MNSKLALDLQATRLVPVVVDGCSNFDSLTGGLKGNLTKISGLRPPLRILNSVASRTSKRVVAQRNQLEAKH